MKRKSIVANGKEIAVHEEQILKFQNEIYALVNEGDLGYLEAITHYCEVYDIEIDTVKNLLSIALQDKLYQEAKELNLLKDQSIDLFDD